MQIIALRRFDPSRNVARFYAVTVPPTLFGSWAVVRRWSRINTDGRRAETWFDDLSPALSCAEAHGRAKLGVATSLRARLRTATSATRRADIVGPAPTLPASAPSNAPRVTLRFGFRASDQAGAVPRRIEK